MGLQLMFLATDEAAERLRQNVEQLRDSLYVLSKPGSANQISEVAAAWVQGEGKAWALMKQEKAEETIEALYGFLCTHDLVFKEARGFKRLCDLVGVEVESTRAALREEMIDPLMQGSLYETNLFKYREMVNALVERMRSLAN